MRLGLEPRDLVLGGFDIEGLLKVFKRVAHGEQFLLIGIVFDNSHGDLLFSYCISRKKYIIPPREARKIRLGGGFSQFFIGNGANCPIKTKIHASLRGSVLVAQRSLTICSVVPKIMSSTSKPFEVFKHHIGSHAPFSFQFQV